jgi:hypothetical protein
VQGSRVKLLLTCGMSECQTPGLMGEISGGSLKLDLLLWPSMPDIEKKHLNCNKKNISAIDYAKRTFQSAPKS